MRPEYSLIILTVLAGAGQGLFILLVTGDMSGFSRGSYVPPMTVLMGIGAAAALTLAGMAASFFHLTHPERGIKAIKKWRFSWLSREVVLLPVFLGAMAAYAGMYFLHLGPMAIQTVGIGGIVVSLALYISTAMIYGQLTFVQQWGTAFTPANFTLTGLICGGALVATLYEMASAPMGTTIFILRILFFLLAAGFLVKMMYYWRNQRLYSPTTIQTALGFNHPKIRQMDTGSAYPHYNTLEYCYTGLEGAWGLVKALSILFLYVFPATVVAWDYTVLMAGGQAYLAPLAAFSAIAGAFMERWLFFVEGDHVQNLYYGNYPERTRLNPVLQAGKKDAPLPGD